VHGQVHTFLLKIKPLSDKRSDRRIQHDSGSLPLLLCSLSPTFGEALGVRRGLRNSEIFPSKARIESARYVWLKCPLDQNISHRHTVPVLKYVYTLLSRLFDELLSSYIGARIKGITIRLP
jgi:hypothetical protein